jgi:lipoprotein-anchoring transpeptidase ErfK/SrfK
MLKLRQGNGPACLKRRAASRGRRCFLLAAGKVVMCSRMLRRLLYPSLLALATLVLNTSLCYPTPPPGVDSGTTTRFFIEISISRNELSLWERPSGSEAVLVAQYPVGTVVRGLKTFPIGPGKVTAISLNPWWYPTAYSRQVFRERGIELPQAVPPGDPLNYMGAVKISLSHKTWKGAIYRIHGNNDPKRVGRRVTGGCFVMNNEEGMALARRIRVGTEVNIVP